jgi:hypothetical protein
MRGQAVVMRFSWNQAICERCWFEQNGARMPTRLAAGAHEPERCCYCGRITIAGIFARDDPATVPFPRLEPEE